MQVTQSKGDKPFGSRQAPLFPVVFSLTNSQEMLLCGEPTSSLQEDQLKSHQSHFESLIGHLEGIFFAAAFFSSAIPSRHPVPNIWAFRTAPECVPSAFFTSEQLFFSFFHFFFGGLNQGSL